MSINTKERIMSAKNGNEEDFSALVSENIALVKSIAKRFADRGVDYEDLVQIGTIGLMRAIKGFDFNFGTTLSTYAVPLIIGEIKRFLRDDGLIKVGREAKTLSAKIKKFSSEFELSFGRSPTVDEVSASLGVDCEQIVFALDATRMPSALEWEGDDGERHEIPAGFDNVEESIDKIALDAALQKLSPFEQKLIKLRYYKGLTQQKTAQILGVTQVKISRDEKKICAKLKTLLE